MRSVLHAVRFHLARRPEMRAVPVEQRESHLHGPEEERSAVDENLRAASGATVADRVVRVLIIIMLSVQYLIRLSSY